jgi:hypothetical protein
LSPTLDGFWIPKGIRDTLITPETDFSYLYFDQGRPCEQDTPGAIAVRWPLLKEKPWGQLLDLLKGNRKRVPHGVAYWERMQAALQIVSKRLSHSNDPIRTQAINSLPAYTGYSEAMIRFTLGSLDLFNLADIPSAFELSPTWDCARAWQKMSDLPGRLRFYPSGKWHALKTIIPGSTEQPLFTSGEPLDFVTGYGAGNVPGTALLIAFMAQATTLAGGAPPTTVIKNSRREPIFSTLILSALEQVDPDLVAATCVLVWDYEQTTVQQLLLSETDLVIAAASDESIDQIREQLYRASGPKSRTRFHAHGHKVSFSVIGKQVLQHSLNDTRSGTPLLDIVALLAGLDSVFWDQHGCLSSRVHFVEIGEEGTHNPMEYAQKLSAQLGILADQLPRGAWPRQTLHDRFDRYNSLASSGQVQVLSSYDDDFVVILDQRQLDAEGFYRQVNDCQGRIIVVRPIIDLTEIPERYLKRIPASNLQSLSVAFGRPGEPLSERELKFAEACGACGVTAIRSVGRGAFPQLAYSWDGLIPLDLTHRRPPGYFTTIEFDYPYDQILETYQLLLSSSIRHT